MKYFLNKGKWLDIKVISIHPLNWNDTIKKIGDLAQGWRLPNIDELEEIYEQLHKTGKIDFPETIYWSSSEFSDDAVWYFDFKNGMDGTAIKKLAARIIAVKVAYEHLAEDRNAKIIVFGDIHGCSAAAETAIALAREMNVRAIFLGDYIDRGPSSKETIKRLMIAKQENNDWVFLRGNHEQMLLDLIDKKSEPDDDIKKLEDTESSYAQVKKTFCEYKQLSDDEQYKISSFLKSTDLYYETENYLFVHAILRETNQNINQKSEDELLWNYKHEPFWAGKNFIHGHLLTEKIALNGTGINIDTKCGYGGVLTALILDNNTMRPHCYFEISENGKLLSEWNILEAENV